ncbi:hypothetical protein OLEAN_C27980 [Oleispira antarctica RB-8]|uniref:Uncharacterized protein n=1 Tax=Oleispira antarctica RB-8 TaxID=698738 RepID=R4YUS8_OLEAN|nr:hypothetical protein OLEAN_C27980 [Oleispira antarctica RB-8]
MIKFLGLSIILPVLILLVLTFSGLGMIALNLVVWPLALVELTGVMGTNPEGIYNRWYDVSIVFSLFIQSIVIFSYFYWRKSHNK